MGTSSESKWRITGRACLASDGLELCLGQEVTGTKVSIWALRPGDPNPQGLAILQTLGLAYARLDDPSLPAVLEQSSTPPLFILEYPSGPSLDEILEDPTGIHESWVLEGCRQVLGAFNSLRDAGWCHGFLSPETCRVRDGLWRREDDLRILIAPPLYPPGTPVPLEIELGDRVGLARILRCFANIASAVQVVTKPLPTDTQSVPPTGPDVAGIIRSLARRLEGGPGEGKPIDPAAALAELRQLIRNQHQLRVSPQIHKKSKSANYLPLDSAELDQATSELLGKIVQREMLSIKAGGWFNRITRHPAFVIPMFLVTVSALVYLLLPPSADDLFKQGNALMASLEPEDWVRGWDMYLAPLETRFPDQAHREGMDEFRERVRRFRDRKSTGREARFFQGLAESQRQFLEGIHLYQTGNHAEAKLCWQGVVDCYDTIPEALPWVQLARDALGEKLTLQSSKSPDKLPSDFLGALDQIQKDFKQGKDGPAKTRLNSLKRLHQNDPFLLEKLKALELEKGS